MSESLKPTVVTVRSGSDTWAVIVGQTGEFFEESVLNCLVISRYLWPNESIKVFGMDEEAVRRLKKKAFRKVK